MAIIRHIRRKSAFVTRNYGKRPRYDEKPMADIEKEWQDRVAAMLKAEMARRNVSYRELEARLREMGIEDNEKNLSTKISRGRFGAAFFFQCMSAIGCRTVRLDPDN